MTTKRQQQHDEDSTEEHLSMTSKSSSGSLSPEHETGEAVSADEEMDQEDTPLAQLLDLLSESELEMAARANYEYWKQQEEPQQSTSSMIMPTDEHRRLLAQPLLQRFLSSQKQNVSKAAKRLKETLQFRQRRKIDRMCTIFDDHSQATTNNGNDTRTSAQQPAKSIDDDDDDDDDDLLRSQLQHDLSAGHVYVQGYDRQGRSTFHFIPRLVPHHTSPEATLLPHIYTLERAVACSRYRHSCQEQEHTSTNTTGTVNAVVDFSGFSIRKHAPPISGARIFLQTLRQHYAGVLHKIYILHAPASFGRLWKLLQHLVAQETRDKIQFVKGMDQNIERRDKNNKNHQGDGSIPDLYDVSQATPWMMPGGQKTRPLDIDEYLFQTPFDKAFDEEEQESMNK